MRGGETASRRSISRPPGHPDFPVRHLLKGGYLVQGEQNAQPSVSSMRLGEFADWCLKPRPQGPGHSPVRQLLESKNFVQGEHGHPVVQARASLDEGWLDHQVAVTGVVDEATHVPYRGSTQARHASGDSHSSERCPTTRKTPGIDFVAQIRELRCTALLVQAAPVDPR